jgi:hypothetical protein
LIEDNFDYLVASQVETSAQSEPLFGGIEDDAGDPFLIAVQIDDARAPLQDHTFRAGLSNKPEV